MVDHGSVEGFYGRWAGLYDLLATRTPGIRRVRERAVDALSLSPGDVVVEMGCGTGANLPVLRERVGGSGTVVGVDLTPGVLARAGRRIRRAGWRNVHLCRGNAAEPPIGTTDAVLGTFLAGMFEDPAAVVDGWWDVVDGDGRIALLDAAPRGREGTLDAAFRLFVAISTPPTTRLRYADPPADRLGSRVQAARAGLAAGGAVVVDERLGRGFLSLVAAERE